MASKKLYFCTSCRKKIAKVQDLLFVEESKRGFCSESCIVEFFSPYMENYDNEELENRHMLGLESSEVGVETFQDKELFDRILYTPDEVWFEQSELKEEYYTHILKYGPNLNLFYILTCSYFEGEPAFVYFKTVTQDLKLVELYRKGVSMNDKLYDSEADNDVEEDNSADREGKIELQSSLKDTEILDEVNLPADVVEDLDLKKSEYLAVLLERRKESDIPFEDFLDYDKYIAATLEDADDEFKDEDAAGDLIMTFIKSFQISGESFFYIVSCMEVTIPSLGQNAMIPILSFPSNDADLYTFYAVGEKKNGKLKN